MAPVTETSFVGGQVPADLAEQFAAVAKAHDRTVSAELRRALKAHVEAHAAEREEATA